MLVTVRLTPLQESVECEIVGDLGWLESLSDDHRDIWTRFLPIFPNFFVPRSYSAVFVPPTGSGKEWVSVKMTGRWLKVIRWDTPTVSVVVATVVLEVFDTTKSCWDSCTRTNKLETALDRGLQWHRSQNRNC